MARLFIKAESLPVRCEICHQVDGFDPETGSCRRCMDLNVEKLLGLSPPPVTTIEPLTQTNRLRATITVRTAILSAVLTAFFITVSTTLLLLDQHVLLKKFEGHTAAVSSVTFSADGLFILSSDEKTIRIWEIENGKEIAQFGEEACSVSNKITSSNGLYLLSGCLERTLQLWDIEAQQEVCRFTDNMNRSKALIFSNDSPVALSRNIEDGIARLFNTTNGQPFRSFSIGYPRGVSDVAISSDGGQILSGDERLVRLWDIKSGKEIRRFAGHGKRGCAPGYITSLAFSPNKHRILSGGHDKTMRLWDIESGKQVYCFEGHMDDVKSVAFSPDGRFALSGGGTGDKTVRLWKLPE